MNDGRRKRIKTDSSNLDAKTKITLNTHKSSPQLKPCNKENDRSKTPIQNQKNHVIANVKCSTIQNSVVDDSVIFVPHHDEEVIVDSQSSQDYFKDLNFMKEEDIETQCFEVEDQDIFKELDSMYKSR